MKLLGGQHGQDLFDPSPNPTQVREGSATSDALDLASLPSFLRVLLVTDGTVTRSLEAYFLEPIDVQVLAHTEVISDGNHTEIEVTPGEPIVKRSVILRGRNTQSAYAFAVSIIASTHVSPAVRRQLVEEKRGIGDLLNEHRLESYRELSGMKRAEAGGSALHLGVEKNATVLVRSYKICLAGRAAIGVHEVFPLSRFERS